MAAWFAFNMGVILWEVTRLDPACCDPSKRWERREIHGDLDRKNSRGIRDVCCPFVM